MKNIRFYIRILFIIGILCFVLFWSQSLIAYSVACIICLLYLLASTATLNISRKEKIIHATIYTIIMILQIAMNFLLIKISRYNNHVYEIYKLVTTILILLPFFSKKILHFTGIDLVLYPVLDKWYSTIYSQFIKDKEAISDKFERVKNASQKINREQINEIIKDAPRHSAFSYINNGSLSDKYFEKVNSTLNSGYIYLVISKSKSSASEIIGAFTCKQYNHISLSFDRELTTIISYNGGSDLFSPGLNPELIPDIINKEGSSLMVYGLKCTKEQKTIISNKVKEINEVGSAYNVTGLLFGYTHRPNIMFCSQFVYIMLEIAKLNYFEKDIMRVKPTDFIELDYYRQLKFMYQITEKESELVKINKTEKTIKGKA